MCHQSTCQSRCLASAVQFKQMTVVYTFTLHDWMDRGEIGKYFGGTFLGRIKAETAIRNAKRQRLDYKGAILVKQWFVLKKKTVVFDLEDEEEGG